MLLNISLSFVLEDNEEDKLDDFYEVYFNLDFLKFKLKDID